MHVSLLHVLYIPSNNAGKNIITKTFNSLDSASVWPICVEKFTLDEPTFLTFLWKTRQTISMRNTNVARLELDESHLPSRVTRFRR